jgi:hypothetical protein
MAADDRPNVQRIHSMSRRDRRLALEVLCDAWADLQPVAPTASIVGAVTSVAAGLPERDAEVDTDYARFAADAAIWYLDRAVRRVADPDLSGMTPRLRAQNLAWFAASATTDDVERLFATAVALNTDDA